MFYKKLFHYLKLLIQTKFEFRPPPHKMVVIYDHGSDQLEFLNKKKCYELNIRGESLNFFILLKSIIENGIWKIKKNYVLTFLRHINPKYIITYRCDNKNFYELSYHLKNTKTILIQWGKSIKEHLINFKSKTNNYHVDEMYLYGDEMVKIFSKFIKGKTFSIGSIANNRFKFNDSYKKGSLIFISQAKSKRIFPEIEKIILKFLKVYCKDKKLELNISTRVSPIDEIGKKNYEEILGSSGWNYYPRKRLDAKGDFESYRRVMQSEYVVFIDSTLGYEAMSRKKKIVAFPFGSFNPEWCKKNYITNVKNNDFYVPTKFGFPLQLKSEGKFWLSKFDSKKMKKKLDFITSIDDQEWKKILDKTDLKKIVNFDLYNKTLIKNLKALKVPVIKDSLMR